jgi:hypothetical protein
MVLFAFILAAVGDWAWGTTGDPNQKSLWHEGRQVGAWKIAEREYWALQGRSWVRAECPVEEPDPIKPSEPMGPPESLKGEMSPKVDRGGAVINYGLDLSKCPKDGEHYAYNGEPITKMQAEALLGATDSAGAKVSPDQLTDDKGHARLTIVGKGGAKLLESIKADARWADLGKGVLAADYPADSWHVRGKGYKQLSPDKPTIYLTDAEGAVIYQGEDMEGLFDGLRRRRDPYSINWVSNWFGINPFTWGLSFGWSRLNIPIEFVLLVIGAVVMAILVLRGKPAQKPKGQGDLS